MARSDTQFKKGNTARKDGSGRQAGTENKTTRILKDAVLLAAEQVGDLSGITGKSLSQEGVEKGKDGLVGYLRWVAKVHPTSFMSILARLLPLQEGKADKFTKTVYRSVEEIMHDVAQRGLNLRGFGKLLLEADRGRAGQYDAENATPTANRSTNTKSAV